MARPEVTGKKPTQTADRAKRRRGPPSADPKAVEPTSHSEPTSTGPAPTPMKIPDDNPEQRQERQRKHETWGKERGVHYIYILCSGIDGEPFYIGITNKPAKRLRQHQRNRLSGSDSPLPP
jgi:GIY-YIG catalytic domain